MERTGSSPAPPCMSGETADHPWFFLALQKTQLLSTAEMQALGLWLLLR